MSGTLIIKQTPASTRAGCHNQLTKYIFITCAPAVPCSGLRHHQPQKTCWFYPRRALNLLVLPAAGSLRKRHRRGRRHINACTCNAGVCATSSAGFRIGEGFVTAREYYGLREIAKRQARTGRNESCICLMSPCPAMFEGGYCTRPGPRQLLVSRQNSCAQVEILPLY